MPPAHLTLMYRQDPDGEGSFCEIRRCGRQLWTASGRTKTFGEAELTECATEDAAALLHSELVLRQGDAGFEVVRSLPYDPETFDYGLFTEEVAETAAQTFAGIREANSGDELIAFAICTDSGVMTIVGAAQAGGSDLTDDQLFFPGEWLLDEVRTTPDIAYRMLLSKMRDIPFERAPDANHQDGVLECLIRGLERARGKGAFPTTIANGDDFLLLMIVMDHAQVSGMPHRLNPAPLADRVVRWYGEDDFEALSPPALG